VTDGDVSFDEHERLALALLAVEAGDFAGHVSGTDLAFDLAETGAINGFERRTSSANLSWIGKSSVRAEDAKE